MLSLMVSVALSAFLLFQIQPMMGKFILPWFGGSAGVWSASLFLFQILLTGGYAYSYWLTKRFSPRKQGSIHLAIVVFALGLFVVQTIIRSSPIFSNPPWASAIAEYPLAAVLSMLFKSIGIPYLILASNSTLMQSWFTQARSGRNPYWLYALSNVGALLGLITYPFVFEPLFSLKTQSYQWSWVYLLYLGITGYNSWRVFHNGDRALKADTPSTMVENQPPLERSAYFKWIGLAALPSILLLATTSKITQEVAAIPFLWVLPLMIYLFSFVLTFSGERGYQRGISLVLLFFATIAYLWFVVASVTSFLIQIVIYLVCLFAATMICHGELYRLRPITPDMPIFYLMVSVGGAFGGLLVNLVAPAIFKGFWEFQLGLGVVWCGLLFVTIKNPIQTHYFLRRIVTAIIALVCCLVIGSLYIQMERFSLNTIASYRNFYGVLSVKEKYSNDPDNHLYLLTHGITTHGYQFLSPLKRRLPTTYYVENSGIGIGIKYHPKRPGPLRVGVIGLGVGVLAAYGEDGDEFRFYELNPAVIDIATSEYFSYLKDAKAKVEIIQGDGRVSLARELEERGSNHFDLLVLDAFNSDSIPIHLLTQEAVMLYRQHLEPGGILALHISNQHLNLRPVGWQIVDGLGTQGLLFYNTTEDLRSKPSLWFLITDNQDFLKNPVVLGLSLPRDTEMLKLRSWTDDYSSLIPILK